MSKKYYAKKAFSFGIYSYRVGDMVDANKLGGEDIIKSFLSAGIISEKPIKVKNENQQGIDEFGIPLGEIENDNDKIQFRQGIKPPAVDGELLGSINDEEKEDQEETQDNTPATNIADNETENKENTQESQEEVSLKDLTKKELIALAEERGIELPKNVNKLSKAKIIEIIEEKGAK